VSHNIHITMFQNPSYLNNVKIAVSDFLFKCYITIVIYLSYLFGVESSFIKKKVFVIFKCQK